MKKLYLLFTFLLFVVSAMAQTITPASGILYVKQGVAGGNQSGDSWQNAVPELANALKWAKQNETRWTQTAPLQIWVAKGTYKPMYTPEDGKNLSANPTDPRDKSFLMVNNVQLYGGFAGTETILTNRDLSNTTNASILSGDIGTLNINTDNVYHVVISVKTPTNTILDGFSVTGGYGNKTTSIKINGKNCIRNYGGGIHNTVSATTYRNLVIFKNTVTGNSAGGGGISNNDNSTSIIHNVIVHSNAAVWGSGIDIFSSSPKISNSLIYNNTNGAGIEINGDSSPIFTNLTISKNTGTGIGFDGFKTPGVLTVNNSIIYGNNTEVQPVVTISGTRIFKNTYIKGSAWDTNWGTNSGGNIINNIDPFVNISVLDFNLKTASSAINVGNNQHWIDNVGVLTGIEVDLAGNLRLSNCIIDMGAFEKQIDLVITSTKTNVSCNGASTASATVTISGGVAPYTYVWNNGITSTTNEATDLSAGIYEVTVTDASGCILTETFTITEPSALNSVPTQVNVLCNGNSTGSATVTVSGGVAPYSYVWNNGITSTTNEASNLSAGSYEVTVTDVNGCIIKQTFTITEPPALNSVPTQQNVLCHGNSTGSATLAISGGVAPYTYVWNNGVTSTTNEATDLSVGNYEVTVTDANGCIITETFTITEPDVININLQETSFNICSTCNDSNLVATITGGTAPYTYNWNDGVTTKDRSDLLNGTYTLTVTDAKGCTVSKSIVVSTKAELPYRDFTYTNGNAVSELNNFTTCQSGAVVTASSGRYTNGIWYDGSYELFVNNISLGVFTGEETIDISSYIPITSVRAVGNHNFWSWTAIDVKTYSDVVDVPPTSPIVSTIYYELNSTAIPLTATLNGVGTTLKWYTDELGSDYSSSAPTPSTNQLGTTSYYVSQANSVGCESGRAKIDVIVVSPITYTHQINNLLCFTSTGSIDLSVFGGTGSYTYLWSNGATTEDITVSQGGNYTCTITDENSGFSITTQVLQVLQPLPLHVTIVPINVACFGGNNGEAIATVTNGTAPYTYSWNDVNNQTTPTATGLVAGTYEVTVTDANNCITTTTVTIAEPVLLEASIALANVVNVSCFDGNDGEATVTVSGGTAPYTYLWNDANTQTTATATGLAAGTYTVTVTDANNCTTTTNVTIAEPTLLEASIALANVVNVSCFDGNDGEAMVTVSGGTAPYTYLWNDANTQTTATATGLEAGTYTVTVTDANNCTTTTNVTITEPLVLEASITLANVVNVSCFDGNDGSAMVTVSGGTAPYTYLWNDANTQTTATATGLAAGTYMVTVTDANNCTTTTNVTIAEPVLLEAAIVLANVVNVSCFNGNDGEATVTVSGGTAPYTYLWNDATAQTTATATGLEAGTYTVTVTDANNCTTITNVTIAEPLILEASITLTNVVNVSCFDGNDGSAMVTVSGGTAPYTYLWNDATAQTTATATGLQAGTYTVTVTDANNCTTTTIVTIAEPLVLEASIALANVVNVSCFDGNDGEATVTVSGGTAPYTYLWNDTNTQTTATATGLEAGTYTVTVSDANNCTTTTNVTVTEPLVLEASIALTNVVNVSCFDGNDGEATVTVTGGTAPYTYLWNDATAQTTATAAGLEAGTYTVTVTDANNCTTTETFTITEPTALNVVPTQTNVLCKGAATGSASVTVSGGVAPYTYTWDNGITSTTHEATDLSAGAYTVNITDANGCTSAKTFTITEPAIIPIPIVTTPIFYTYGDTALALDALVDNGNTLLWYDAATGGLGSTNAFIPSTDTIGTQTYWVSQLTADGCESERVAIEVNVSPAILIVMADENQTKVYGSADPVFTYTATGFQFNDNDNVFTGLLSRDPGENVGTYPIHQGSLSAGPAYTITFVEATFNITAAELIVTPNNGQTKVYGSADPVYQYTVSGFVAGDSFSVISGLLGRLPGENVGNYLYHSGTLTSVHNNYTFTVLPEYFIITPAPIDVVVNPGQHKMYGTSDPFFNYSALGLVNGDSPYTAFTGVLQRSMGENVGIYAINQGTLQTNANYQLISFTAADFEIVPALIANLQLNDATYVYDGTPKSLVVTGPVDPNAQINYTGNNQINAGTYTVTATVDYGSNYQQLVLTATLTIVRANQTIFFEIDSPVILEDTPPFNLQATATSGLPVHYTYTYSGIQPAEVSASGAVELLAPGEVHITAHQDGDNNYNAAVPVTRTLVIESRDSGIWDLYIDDEHFAQPADEIFVIKGCDDTNSASVEIRVETQIGATVSPSPIIIVPTPDYGIYEVEIVVTSQNGQHTKTYKVVIDKRLPWENILMQKYDNVVFINNNPATNGGYKFVRYEWYKNDVKVADQQLFSEGATMHDLIDLSASYHAVLYTDDGKVLTTCSMTIIHKHDYSLTVYPNPVVANGILNVTYDVPHDVFTAIDYVIFTTSGQFVSRGTLEQSAAQINLPATLQSGTYILVLNINGKNKSVRFVIK